MALTKVDKRGIRKSMSSVGTFLNSAGNDEFLYLDLLNKKLHNVLLRGVEKFFNYENLLLSRNTLIRAAEDIIRLSSGNPNGLRGSLVEVFIRSDKVSVRIAKVVSSDSNTSPFTVLKLTLDEDRKGTSINTLALKKGYTIERCPP